ncbi:UNKNOWN [Stylonychia lemnae]|uniref:Uncharacterized protein n=1 Tax=Stylonychia lemnae TaxID=5949 RepID=A0A078BA51_STYLE|nr:UNKNOWN [Stylonychia lemnae]|eukprot:CDW90157.1 UNKNOWN [Stylonychia lemnae]
MFVFKKFRLRTIKYFHCCSYKEQDRFFMINQEYQQQFSQESIRYTQKFNEVLFVIGNDNEMDVLSKGKGQKQQFVNNQITAIDFDSQELIGKIQFKHEISKMEIKSQFLIVAFVHKIIVCDVYTLKHLLKISTEERAQFDSNIETDFDQNQQQ